MWTARVELAWFLAGLTALIVGALIYITDRDPNTVYFLSTNFSLFHARPDIFGQLGNHFPTLLHSFALILITAAVIGSQKVSAILVSLIWMLTELIFEIAQTQFISELIATHIPSWFGTIPVLENTRSYFLLGTFDVMDLLSIVAGSVTAYVLIQLTKRSSKNEALKIQTI